MLFFHKAIAESVLMYRFNRLPAALAKAAAYGYAGTMFPWESRWLSVMSVGACLWCLSVVIVCGICLWYLSVVFVCGVCLW